MKLTKNEWKVMEILWTSMNPMTSAEIAEHADGWKPSYIHLMIKSLLEKGVIEIVGFIPTTKNYARTFAPTMTREGLMVREIFGENPEDDMIVSVVREIYRIADEGTKEKIRKEIMGGE